MSEKFKKNNAITLTLVMLIAGIVLVLFSGNTNKKQEKSDTVEFNEAEYEQGLETRLKKLIEKIDGVGEVSVMVTLEGSALYTYATDTSNDAKADGDVKSESTVVLSVNGTSKKEAVVRGYYLPEIKGAAVICSKRLSASMQSKVIGTVSAALGIPTNKIFVTN